MWTQHWQLTADPFRDGRAPYVRTSGHDEAVARLVASIETGERLAVLRASAGFGKTTVLARAVAETKGPRRRFAWSVGPVDGPGLLAGLATGLGVAVAPGASRAVAWKALADAVRLCHWQKTQAVLIVDGCHDLEAPADRLDLQRLTHLTPDPSARLTVIRSFREPDDGTNPDDDVAPAWLLDTRLPTLLRSETVRFVEEKLAAAGRDDPAFTPRALWRLHDLSGGVPRGIDRLGSLCLMAGALRGLELVTPDVVDGVAAECTGPRVGFAA